MADFWLCETTIRCVGDAGSSPEAQAEAIKSGKSPGGKKALKYVEKYRGTVEYGDTEVVFKAEEFEMDFPDFGELAGEFLDIVFILDFYYEGTASGCKGSGRIFQVYERKCLWLRPLS